MDSGDRLVGNLAAIISVSIIFRVFHYFMVFLAYVYFRGCFNWLRCSISVSFGVGCVAFILRFLI